MKKIIVLSAGLLFAAFLMFVLKTKSVRQNTSNQGKKIRVVTTLYPLYDFAKKIGGEDAEVTLLLPPGVETHSFEPAPADIVRINTADIFIYTGKFMEVWADKILAGIDNKSLVIVDASRGTEMIPAAFHDADQPAGSLDPHIWLDFNNAKIMAGTIADAFIKKDPARRSGYEANLAKYDGELSRLDMEYKNTLSTCRRKEIVYAGHYAFGYLAKRYGLKYWAAEGVSADTEPTTQDMIGLVNQIKESNIKYIFYEELTTPRIAETIAKETGAKMLLLNAGHNISKKEAERGISYTEIMDNNLKNLRVGLECK